MTPPTAVPLDAVDMAFLQRAEALVRPLAPTPAAVPFRPAPARRDPPPRSMTLVERLLAAVPEEWLRLSLRVEEACAGGATVIAVAGGRAGEGRSTVVACLAQALVDRGHGVDIHDRAPVEPPASRCSGYAIALVDAGVWFPGGPLRRSWLAKRSLGCQAAILVRRADEAACPARETALAAVGLLVLGEVLTMAPPTTHAIRVAGGSAS